MEIEPILMQFVPSETARFVILEAVSNGEATIELHDDGNYWYHDPYFSSEPCLLSELDYNSEIGLHKKR